MNKDNKQQKLSDSTEPAIAYTPCYKRGKIILYYLQKANNLIVA